MLILMLSISIGISIYLILDTKPLKQVVGLILLGNVINIVLFVCGRVDSAYPAFIGGEQPYASPLPQAMVLTAIVIGFGLLAFLCSLLKVKCKDR